MKLPCAAQGNPTSGQVRSKIRPIDRFPARSPPHRAPARPPAGPRRDPGHRLGGRVLLPRVFAPDRHGSGRDVRLLRAQRVPHHTTSGRGAHGDRARVAVEFLRPPCPAPAPRAGILPGVLAGRGPDHPGPRAVDDDGAGRRCGCRHLTFGRARRRRGRPLVCHELGRHRELVHGLRAAGAPVVPGGGGAVLPALVSGGRPPLVVAQPDGGVLGRLSLALDMGTDTRAGAFLVGAALAVAWSRRSRWLRTVEILGGRATVAVTLAVLAVGSWVFDHRVSRLMFTGTWVAVSVAAGLLVIAYLGNERARRGGDRGVTAGDLRRPPLLCPLSVALRVAHVAGLPRPPGHPVGAGRVLRHREISWRLVEEPTLSLKRRFSSTAPALASSVPRNQRRPPPSALRPASSAR